MTYTVVWSPSAERSLSEIWTNARDRQAVADAANAIDALLRLEPSEAGESRLGYTRIVTVSPLWVNYDLRTDDRLVVVWAVWRARRRPPKPSGDEP
jgi:plasmid stabilization system protein ParE